MFVAVNSVRVVGESNIMEEFLKLSENHVTVFVMFPVVYQFNLILLTVALYM